MTGGPRRGAAGLLAVALLGLLTACGGADGTDGGPDAGTDAVVRVAAASDLKFALDELVDTTLAEQHPGIRVEATYGSSGVFVQQISNGAPFDLYLSADLSLAEGLVADGLAEQQDVFAYAVGRLVVWTPEGSAVDPSPGLPVLLDPAVRTVAIANPEHAPYGRAAVAALETAGLTEQVRPKLVLGENIAQAAEFVSSGGADAGVVAMSLVLSDPLREQGRWQEVPLEDYPRLDQGGVVLAGASDPDAARAVRDVLLGPEGTALLERYGFYLPGT